MNNTTRPARLRLGRAVLAAALCCASVPALPTMHASAASADVWHGGGVDNNWSTAANWAGGSVPAAGQSLVFPAGAATLTPHDDLGINVGRIEFDAPGYYLTGAGLTVAGPITTGAGIASGLDDFIDQPLTLSGALDVRIGIGASVALLAPSGTGHLVKNGAGTLMMEGGGGTSTDTTPTAVNAGTLEMYSDSALGSPNNPGGIVIAAGAGMRFPDVPTCVTLQQPLTVAGRGPGGAGALAGCARFNGSTVTLSGNATFGSAGSGNAISEDTSSTLLLGTHTLTIAAPKNFMGALISGSGGLVYASTGTFNALTANNTYTGQTRLKGGFLEIAGQQPSSSAWVSGTATLLGNGTVGPLVATNTATVQPGLDGNISSNGQVANILHVQGAAVLRAGTTLLTCIADGAQFSSCAYRVGTAGELSATGRISVTGALLKITSQTDNPIGTAFTVASAAAGISGRFANAAQGAVLTATNGTHYVVSYHRTSVIITRVA